MMNRREFLRGVVIAAPAVILTPGLLMKVRPFGWRSGIVAFPNRYPDSMLQVVRVLRETDEMLKTMEFVEQPDTGVVVASRAFARAFYASIPPAKPWFKLVLPEGE